MVVKDDLTALILRRGASADLVREGLDEGDDAGAANDLTAWSPALDDPLRFLDPANA